MKTVGFVGIGLMGEPMAKRLIDYYQVLVYNRTKSKTEEIVKEGAKYGDSPRRLTEEADYVVVMVSDDPAVEAVFEGEDGIFAADNHPILINMSTITPELSKKMAEKAINAGFLYVEAPVSGTVGPARDGTLTILVAGQSDVIDQVRPVLQLFGKQIYQFNNYGDALKVKLLVNLNLAVQTTVLAETLVKSKELGLNTKAVLEVINNSAVSTIISKVKGPNMIEDQFPTAFPYSHMIKDLTYGLDMAEIELAEKTLEMYQRAEQDLDFSAIYKTLQK